MPVLSAVECLHLERDSSHIPFTTYPSSNTTQAAQTTGLINHPNREDIEQGSAPSSIAQPEPAYNNKPSLVSPESSSAAFESPTTPRFLGIHSSWCAYIDARHREWVIVAASAVTLATASAPFLQMLDHDDPLIRSLVFLSLSRAISAIAYAIILLLHFRHAQAKVGQFAVRWFQYVKVHENSVFCMPWTILAMPAVALCWGVIILIIALFCSIWRTGFVRGPSTPPTTTDIYSSNIVMRVVITGWSVLDVASILWFLKTLRELTPGQSYARH